ncbi:phage head closure protein [Ensifer soli]|uniref:phage head closure protein n=1 Tax=Ciceribacter sp. sgz301302 TaxID=3342379 RepID=UPI0035BA631A
MRIDLHDAGQMSARLSLEAFAGTGDGQGGTDGAYAPVAALWARIEPVSMAAEERSGEDVAVVTHRIWLRFRHDVVSGMRLTGAGRVFSVRATIDPDETRRFLVCLCREERP